jgi:hypothetical protein
MPTPPFTNTVVDLTEDDGLEVVLVVVVFVVVVLVFVPLPAADVEDDLEVL